MKRFRVSFIMFSFTLFLGLSNLNAQVLETEESKPIPPGQTEVGMGLEFQTSKEGTEAALPLAIEYGLTDRFTALIEPVLFTSIDPKTGTKARGLGDLELTLFYQVFKEQEIWPSVSVSGEVKIPTAKNTLIGTGKTDYTPFLIFSKTTGNFFTSLNLSYTFVGQPKGVVANNLFNYALGTIFTISPKSILFAEFYGNTSALGEGETPEVTSTKSNVNVAELSGGETVGAVGYGYYINKEFLVSLGVSYDNNHAILIRPGLEIKF